jgi:myo-inositol-1(or 4)-monophosphatase
MERRLRKAIIDAVRHAGQASARAINRKPENKPPKDFVTQTDKRNERLIIKAIRSVDPAISVWAEESGKDMRNPDRVIIIDPLDATTNFVKGLKEYSIMVALYEENEPRFGVVYIPRLDEFFVAEKGKGARLNGKPLRVSGTNELDRAVISFNRSGFPDELVVVTPKVIGLLAENAFSWRNLGTAGVEYSHVARGTLDGVVTPLAESVHAAGYLLMSEAGAKVTDHLGIPISFESKTLVAANPRLHERLLGLVGDVFAKP